jgi:hypothetical protein
LITNLVTGKRSLNCDLEWFIWLLWKKIKCTKSYKSYKS